MAYEPDLAGCGDYVNCPMYKHQLLREKTFLIHPDLRNKKEDVLLVHLLEVSQPHLLWHMVNSQHVLAIILIMIISKTVLEELKVSNFSQILSKQKHFKIR